jgi:hypothetical protein
MDISAGATADFSARAVMPDSGRRQAARLALTRESSSAWQEGARTVGRLRAAMNAHPASNDLPQVVGDGKRAT